VSVEVVSCFVAVSSFFDLSLVYFVVRFATATCFICEPRLVCFIVDRRTAFLQITSWRKDDEERAHRERPLWLARWKERSRKTRLGRKRDYERPQMKEERSHKRSWEPSYNLETTKRGITKQNLEVAIMIMIAKQIGYLRTVHNRIATPAS